MKRTDTERKLKQRGDKHFRNMVLSDYQRLGLDKQELDEKMKEFDKRLK